MTLRLHILRHADAQHGPAWPEDFDRPLSARGRLEAARAGLLLSGLAPPPGLALVSSAVRARETADLALESAGFAPRRVDDARLYLAPARRMLELLREFGEGESALVVAHQPGCAELVCLLATGDERTLELRFPTAALARVDVEAERWTDVREGGGRFVGFEPSAPD